jgi:RNA polymerase sigma factor for flagellar operon FliA
MPYPSPPVPEIQPNPDTWRDTLIAHLPLIRRVVGRVCRRHGRRGEQEQELFSDVCVKLLEHDGTAFRQFRGQSSLTTYLHVVVRRVQLDRRIREWGRWRPTTRARAMGESAVLLEQLIARDGYRLPEALGILSQTAQARLTERDALRLAAAIRPRRRQCMASLDQVGDLPDGRYVSAPTARTDLARQAADLKSALMKALRLLRSEDLELLRLRYSEGQSVANIARATGQDHKRLYRRYERLLDRLRLVLARDGYDAASVRGVVGQAVVDISGAFEAARPAA